MTRVPRPAPSRASIPPLLAGFLGWGWKGFCSAQTLIYVQKWSLRRRRGVFWSEPVSACHPQPPQKIEAPGGHGVGGGAADGGAGLGHWLTLRVAAGLLGADGRGEGRLFPSHHSFHLLLPSALQICMSLLVSRSLKALAPPPVPGPRLPLPPVRQFRECPAPAPPPAPQWGICVRPQSPTPTLSL